MKIRLLPIVASICGLAFCTSAARAGNSVYVHNKPLYKVADAKGTTYAPFKELMKSLHRGWTVEDGVVKPCNNTMNSDVISGDSFTLATPSGNVSVQGFVKNGELWVPVRIAKNLGFEVHYNGVSRIIDILTPRLISDADRAAEEEVAKARAEKAAQLLAEEEAARQAATGEDTATAEKDGGASETAEGNFPASMDGNDDSGGVNGVVTYADYLKVQEELDRKAAAKRAEMRGESSEPAPAPNVLAFAPRAAVDYFTGRVNMTASIKNIGKLEAKSLSATLNLYGPDGSLWTTRRLTHDSIGVDGEWSINESYLHPYGAEIPRGDCILRVDIDYANKPGK